MAELPGIKRDFLFLSILFAIVFAIFYPVFYTEYVYTDEIVQLFLYKKGTEFQMFLPQGRYITEKLFRWLFERAGTIKDITYIRLFSLAGWIVCIPVWYFILKRIVANEKLPLILAFFSTLYMVCTPQFSIYIGWAACFELFLGNTAGLVSGYFFYQATMGKRKTGWRLVYVILSIITGLVSLFTYQNGFGCFLLPFLLIVMGETRLSRRLVTGLGMYLLMYGIYYGLFRYNLSVNNIVASERTGIHIKPIGKLKFLFTRVLSSSFHFTYIFNEKSIPGIFVYCIFFAAWSIGTFIQQRALPVLQRINYFLVVCLFFALIYLPSLVVKENYASNRTLFALNIAVFMLVAMLVHKALKQAAARRNFVIIASALFFINAWYNFHKLFLEPVTNEYKVLRAYIENNYSRETNTVYFIRPEEDFFVRKYGITRSWDEFGVPSSFFAWVPEFLVKQIVFEKTGDRMLAEKITVKDWLGEEAYRQSGAQPGAGILLINAKRIVMDK